MSHSDESTSDASEASSSDTSASDASSKKAKAKEKKVKSKKGKDKKEKSKEKSKDKKEKKSKSTKRGPRGAQWMTWKIPFQESSVLGQTFQMAAKKGGIETKKLLKFVKAKGGTPAFILRLLKRGVNRGWKWDVDDAHGRLRIANSKLDKKYKKVA